MSTRQRKQSKIKPLLLPACCFLIIGYFAYNAVIGQYGLTALWRLAAEKRGLTEELAALNAERERLERQVSLMRPESVDSDILDERARQALNLVHRNDLVIFASRDQTISRAPPN